MNDTQEPTKEQQDELIVKALELSGFEYNEFIGIHVKPYGDKQIVVDLKDGKHGIWFNVDKKAVMADDDEGTLAKVADIITDAMVGKMPTKSDADEVVNVPKKDGPAPVPKSPKPIGAEPMGNMTDTGNVPTVPEPSQACTPTEIIPPRMMPYSMNQIQTIKNTVAKGINDSELEMFLHISQAYGLDPFLKEIFYSSQLKTIMTSRDGYLKVAQRDHTFDGIQSMAVCENDEFEIDAVTPTVIHKFGKGERGKVIGGWAIVHKKGRRPVISYADIREYKKNNNVWNTYESAMICKVAEAFSLKRQFGISGLVTQEELE